MIKSAIALLAKCAAAVAGLLIRRSASVWVVGGGRGLRYADNSMHFFKQSQNLSGLRVVWLTRSHSVLETIREEGFEAHLIGSPAGIWLGLRACWHVFDVSPADTGATSFGAYRLNLWHGIPLKNLTPLTEKGPIRLVAKRMLKWLPGRMAKQEHEFFLHPNRRHADHVLKPFDILYGNLIVENLPRNMAIMEADYAERMATRSDIASRARLTAMRSEGKTIIGYFPTWRSHGEDRFLGTTDPDQMRLLSRYLETNDCILVTKWHACSFDEYKHYGRSRTANDISAMIAGDPRIMSLSFSTDLNSILGLCDLLVTDYSSVLFDYLLTDRPQIFVPYDISHYKTSPGLLFDYETFVPGPITHDINQFLDALSETLAGNDPNRGKYAEMRRLMRNSFFESGEWNEDLFQRMRTLSAG